MPTISGGLEKLRKESKNLKVVMVCVYVGVGGGGGGVNPLILLRENQRG